MKFFSYICKCVALDTGMCALTSNLSSLARLEINPSFTAKTSFGAFCSET